MVSSGLLALFYVTLSLLRPLTLLYSIVILGGFSKSEFFGGSPYTILDFKNALLDLTSGIVA